MKGHITAAGALLAIGLPLATATPASARVRGNESFRG
jgi:hypothetical protein